MAAETAGEGRPERDAGQGLSSPPRRPARPVPEIVRDLQQERERLVAAVDQLKLEARVSRQRVLSARSLAIVGGAVVALLVLRRRRRRR